MTGGLPSTGYLLAGLGVMFLVTVVLRAAPFVALTRLRDSQVVRYLGRTMPAGVMVVLVVYTLRDTTTALGSWLPAAAALTWSKVASTLQAPARWPSWASPAWMTVSSWASDNRPAATNPSGRSGT